MFHNLTIKEVFLERDKLNNRQRPYHVGTTGSRSITKVKLRRARLVLGWVTAWEHRVLLVSFFLSSHVFYQYIFIFIIFYAVSYIVNSFSFLEFYKFRYKNILYNNIIEIDAIACKSYYYSKHFSVPQVNSKRNIFRER